MESKSKLPQLPQEFTDLYPVYRRLGVGKSECSQEKDDIEQYGWRRRAVAHRPGYYPSHVYIDVELSGQDRANISDTLAPIKNVQSLLESDLGVPRRLHISLSPTLMIRAEDREEVVCQLQTCLTRYATELECHGMLNISLGPQLIVLPSQDHLSAFVALPVQSNQELHGLSNVINTLLNRLELSTLSDDHIYHMSIARVPVDSVASSHSVPLASRLSSLEQSLDIEISQLKVVVGNDIHTFDLRS